MSGSNEERPTPADEDVEPAAGVETPAAQAASSEAAAEMTAAEALAQATAAAAQAAPPPQQVEAPTVASESKTAAPAESEPEPPALDNDAQEAAQPVAVETSTAAPETTEAESSAVAGEAHSSDGREPEPVDSVAATVDESGEPAEPPHEAAAPAEPIADDPTEDPGAAPEADSPDVAKPEDVAPEAPVAAPPVSDAAVTDTAVADAPVVDAPATDTAVADASAPPEDAVAEAAPPAAAVPATPKPPERPEMRAVHEAMTNHQSLEGRVIGWNNGGFHLALGELSAFCPRSEMEVGDIAEPESYLDRTFMFRVLRLQGKSRRIVVSRAAHLRKEKSRQRNELRKRLKVGTELDGTVASLTDFGAFVDLGGAQGLVHVSEISHRRVEHPSHVLSEGQEVRVKVLKVEQGGRRISLSIRALEPDPWKDLADRFPQGAVVKGTVEKAIDIGAFIELAPGLTGLLPAKSMSIPRETSPARAYPPGKEVTVQIVSVDPRRQRISLALEGSGLEGSRGDYQEFKRQSREGGAGDGFNALASAFRRLQGDSDR